MARAASTSPLRGSRRRTLATLRVRLMCNSREREAAQNKNGRATSSGQDVSNSRGDVQPLRRSAGCACKTGRPRWKNQIRPTLRQFASRPAVSAPPMSPRERPSFRYADLPESQWFWHRAGATMPGHESRRPDKLAGAATHLRGSVGMQECFRDRTQHTLWVTLRSFIPGAQGTRETLCWK